eukprot:m.228268 g.228268  ORF g.228268 m.228268 type:complete len:346 (-) comp11718_c0_seq1:83-1120(-)
MASCPRCGQVFAAHVKFCTNDGTPIVPLSDERALSGERRPCPSCGVATAPDNAFCANCGTSLKKGLRPSMSTSSILPGELQSAEWFHPSMSRERAEEKLASQPVGTFLIRESKSSPGAFTLNVAGRGKVFNFLINCHGAQYQLSSPTPQPYFNTLDDLVRYHRQSPLADGLLLTTPPLSTTISQSPSMSDLQAGVRTPVPDAAVSTQLRSQTLERIEETQNLLDLMPIGAIIVNMEKQHLLEPNDVSAVRAAYKSRRQLFAMGLPPNLWIPDKDVTACPACSKGFSATRRRHHCRCCGHVFCGPCSADNFFKAGISLERLCKPCLQFLVDIGEGKVPAVRPESRK